MPSLKHLHMYIVLLEIGSKFLHVMGDFVLDLKIGFARDYMHICTSESYKGDTMRVPSACDLSIVSLDSFSFRNY